MSLLRFNKMFAAALLLGAAACADLDEAAVALDNDPPLADRDELLAGAPKADEIPSEWKADHLQFPHQFDLRALQSPVKSQGSRGVCSIFSTTALMEHLYIKEGTITNPDFSEQYLQWSVKNEVGAFKNTSGSNDQFNIQAISQFGIPAESAWPYESAQWGAFDDPECAPGEDPDAPLPTRCYTNGEPPQAAREAEKFFLPRGRFISHRDIKAQMVNRGQAVVVGMDFFYQAWNHRKSQLPITPENWNAGIVLYPNEDDKRISLEKRAGHAILLIGWDDDLEVPVRDKDGNTVTDASGKQVTEKGFYLFKNSWGTAGFGIDNPFGPGYGWISMKYIAERGSVRASDLPTVVRPVELCGDGLDNDRDGAIDCDDSDCADSAECTGGSELTFDGPAGQSIPDNSPVGAAATLRVDRSGTIGALTVRLSIKHTYRGDLRVTLSHGGKTVTLHDRAGGSADDLVLEANLADFNGLDLAGDWRLLVVDTASLDVGTIESWSITALIN
jgi:hypothetical protein